MEYELEEERYRVHILRSPITGTAVEERWETSDGALHRIDGPALTTRDPDTETVISEHFFRDGMHHRDNGEPAYLEFDNHTGVCVYRAFFEDGQYRRAGGLPHVEWIDPVTSLIYREEYKLDRASWSKPRLHREEGPALLVYNRQTGDLIREEYFKYGRKHSKLTSQTPPPPDP